MEQVKRNVEDFIPLFRKIATKQIATKVAPYYLDVDDVISMCWIGFEEADEKFDCEGEKFLRICTTIIKRRLIDQYRQLSWANRQSLRELKAKGITPRKMYMECDMQSSSHDYKSSVDTVSFDSESLDLDILNVLVKSKHKYIKEILVYRNIDKLTYEEINTLMSNKYPEHNFNGYAGRTYLKEIDEIRNNAKRYTETLK
jgi:DNA-directed RNA polymerase specialized sigma subunit